VYLERRRAEVEAVRRTPTRRLPERVDGHDAAAIELDGEPLRVQRLVGEVPRPPRAVRADAEAPAQLAADRVCALAEPDAAERASRYESPRPRQSCGGGRGERGSGQEGHEKRLPHMLGSMSFWDSLAGLELRIDGYALARRESQTPSGWTRVTTVVEIDGEKAAGVGEDVTYEAESHDGVPTDLMLAGTWTLEDFSPFLDGFPELAEGYRRWAFESAALDLALRQTGLRLGEALGRPERPVRFVVSTRADPATWLAVAPDLEFKLDAETDWDRELLRGLRALDRVRVVDLKAYYRGTSVDLAPDPELYRAVAEELPDVVIEDAWLEDGCLEALAGAEDRLSFDAPVHSLADLDGLSVAPQWLNIKPSRFGTVRELLATIEAAEERGIRMYGGGQFELGPGRLHIQRLASVFYPDGPNDVAPSAYNEGEPREGLPQSPLPPREEPGL
jgi:hypothetical protein